MVVLVVVISIHKILGLCAKRLHVEKCHILVNIEVKFKSQDGNINIQYVLAVYPLSILS